jgi:hypothetical protein
MYVVRLVRRLGVHPETYGRVLFDGETVQYDGLSGVFRKQLERGIVGQHKRRYMPSDGMDFLRNLRFHFADDVLRASDVDSG